MMLALGTLGIRIPGDRNSSGRYHFLHGRHNCHVDFAYPADIREMEPIGEQLSELLPWRWYSHSIALFLAHFPFGIYCAEGPPIGASWSFSNRATVEGSLIMLGKLCPDGFWPMWSDYRSLTHRVVYHAVMALGGCNKSIQTVESNWAYFYFI